MNYSSAIILLITLITGCDNKISKVDRRKGLNQLEGDFTITSSKPLVAKAGEKVEITGDNFSDVLIFSVNGQEIKAEVSSATQASFIMPEGLENGKVDAMAIKSDKQKPFPLYALDNDNYPLIAEEPSEVCLGKKYYNAEGDVLEGLKECEDSVPECSKDGEIGCLTTETAKAALVSSFSPSDILAGKTIAGVTGTTDLSNLTPANIASGVSIAGITGAAILELHNDCASDGETGCVATAAFKAADMTNATAPNIRSSVAIAGVTGNYAGSNPDCSSDGEVGCVTVAAFKAAEMANVTQGSIKAGVTIAGVSGLYPNATYRLPGADGGTADLTSGSFVAQVKSATAFEYWDSTGVRYTGAGDADIAAANIKTGVEIFAENGSVVQSPGNCAGNAQQGCVTTATYQSADLTNLSAGNIKAGVTIAGQTGDYPSVTYRLTGADATADLPAFASTSGGSSYEWFQSDGSRLSGSVQANANVTPSASDQTLNAGLYRSVTVAGDADLVAGNIKVGEQIFGVNGSVAGSPGNCTGNGQQGCVTTATYQSADFTNLSEGNIKNGVTVAGVLGKYPSATHLLAGQDATADLDFSTFNAKIKSSASFEWFDAKGERYTNSGDAHIQAGLILEGIDIFGTTGTFASGSISVSDLDTVVTTGNNALSWSRNGAGVIIVRRIGASVTWQPSHGINYGTGAVDADHEIVYQGPLTSFNDIGGSEAVFNYYKAYAYNSDFAFSSASNEVTGLYTTGEICGGAADGCYGHTDAKTAGVARTYSNKHLEYVNNGTGLYVWKEQGSNRILRANGADEWAKKLNASGKGLSGTDFTDYTAIIGRVCPNNVYIDDANKFTTGNCIYYTSETNQKLDADGTDGVNGLNSWNNYNGGSAKWYVGNIQTCSAQGMRMPTMYETTTTDTTYSYYPTSDGSPTFAQGNGVPSNGGETWTASACTNGTSRYCRWSSTSASNYMYYGVYGLHCVLP